MRPPNRAEAAVRPCSTRRAPPAVSRARSDSPTPFGSADQFCSLAPFVSSALLVSLALLVPGCGHGPAPASAAPARAAGTSHDTTRSGGPAGRALAADPAAKAEAEPADRHRPDLRLPPDAVLALLQQDNRDVADARQRRAPVPPPLRRPAGARGRLAVILACADAGLDLGHVFRREPEDVYWLSSPGPCLRSEEAALVVRAARDEETSLAVVLVHEECASLADTSAFALAESLRRRVAPARAIAADSGRSLALVYGTLQAEQLLQASPDLAALHAAGSFAVVVGIVQPSTGRVTWHTPAGIGARPPR